MPKRIWARCHQKGGRGVAVGALAGTAYHLVACLHIGLASASERVFALPPALTGLDAALCWHISALYVRLTGGHAPLESSAMWGTRLTAIFLGWLVAALGLALVGGAIGLAWAFRPGHHHRKSKAPPDDPAAG